LGEGHPLVGCSAPDFEFADGTRLGALLLDGKGLLADFTESGPFNSLAKGWAGRVNYFWTSTKDSKGIDVLLVRPNGFVA
jgi:hypothetical protein